MREKPWRVKLEPQVEEAFRKIRSEESRGIDAIDGFLRFVQRAPLDGFVVPRMPGVLSRPFHTGRASYLVIYEVEGDLVTCLGIRQVPRSAY